MEKTLVIHPYDPTTEFLRPIYSGLEGAVVLRGNYTKDYVRQMIEESDRVIMLGHGSPSGLFSIGKFQYCNNGLIIDESMVAALGRKKNNMYIWCNADQFVTKHNLKGLYSGMFISEVGEAHYCGLPGTPQSVVDMSNDSFARWMGENANMTLTEIFHNTMDNYEVLAMDNPVADYNAQRMCLAE